MKNPLAVFTGLALASLAGLVVVTMERPPNSASEKLAGGETPAIGEQPAMKTAQAPETSKPPEVTTPEEAAGSKMASTETKPAETGAMGTKPVDNSAAGAEADKDSLKSAEPAKKPEFDTVRVESDGTAIVAGQAKPGTQVTLKLDGAEIGKGMANEEGAWVVIPDTPLPTGSHEITAEQKEGEGAPVVSDQSVSVAVSPDGKKAPMIAVLEPGQAAKVLNSGTQESEIAATQQPSTSTGEPNQVEQQQASTEPAKQQTGTETVAKSTQQQASLEAGQAKKLEPLSVDGVDYGDRGDIIFSGRATSGTAVRLYIDSQPLGDAIVSGGNSWSFSGQQSISPGKHSLRADQIDSTGKVVARVELPFLREESSRVVALNESDSAVESPSTDKTDKSTTSEQQKVEPPAVEQKQASSEPSDSQSQPETAVQSQAAKIPEPESSQAGEQTVKAPESSKASGETLSPAQTEGSTAAKPESTTELSETAPTTEKPAASEKQATLTTQPEAQADAGATAIEAKEPAKARSGRVVIQPHNNLWKLSRVIYGRGAHYRVIYSANKDQIHNPNRIYPGQIFTIPNASPPESIDPKRKEPLTADEGAGSIE